MLTLQDRVQIVLMMAELKSVTLVRRKWTSANKPSEITIRNTYKKFIETGSVQD